MTSGLLTSSYNSGTLQYTLPTILNEFSNPGGGTVDLNASTFTESLLSEFRWQHTSSTQVTDASLTGTVTYNFIHKYSHRAHRAPAFPSQPQWQ